MLSYSTYCHNTNQGNIHSKVQHLIIHWPTSFEHVSQTSTFHCSTRNIILYYPLKWRQNAVFLFPLPLVALLKTSVLKRMRTRKRKGISSCSFYRNRCSMGNWCTWTVVNQSRVTRLTNRNEYINKVYNNIIYCPGSRETWWVIYLRACDISSRVKPKGNMTCHG